MSYKLKEMLLKFRAAIARHALHWPGEALKKDGTLADGWVLVGGICPFSLQEAGDNCISAVNYPFKITDKIGKCTVCKVLEEQEPD